MEFNKLIIERLVLLKTLILSIEGKYLNSIYYQMEFNIEFINTITNDNN